MCGIFGMILPNDQEVDRGLFKNATDRLIHRGPDDSGYFFKEHFALGNRRLAILDLSPDGQQPMHYQDCTITYNGEIYNYLELRKELEHLGFHFSTKTDTEVILAAYKAWGINAVNKLNGMWAFALYDAGKNQIFCSRDRFGIKPFYYLNIEGCFAFASEIKALSILPGWNSGLNKKMAFDYLIRGLQNHTDQTLYNQVNQLRPGHNLIFDLKAQSFTIEQYYTFSNSNPLSSTDFDSAVQQFKTLLESSIKLHARSDVKVGVALSGGLDSSTIATIHQNTNNRSGYPLEAFFYASPVIAFDESPYVESLLHESPMNLHKVRLDFEETIAEVDNVILAQDEPLQSMSLIAQYAVFQEAKRTNIKVVLDGQGADEILAGYGTYYIPFLKELFGSAPLKLIPEIFGLLSKHKISWIKKKSFFTSKQPLEQHLHLSPSDFAPQFSDFKSYSIYMIKHGILPSLLQFDDRNSMAHSVESRVPFLDYRLVEFCLNLPSSFKIRNGVRKAILRQAMKKELPQKIINRYDKMGFSTPQQYWMSEHKEFFRQRILSIIKQYPTIFKKSLIPFIESIFDKEQSQHYAFCWRIFAFGRWIALNNIRP